MTIRLAIAMLSAVTLMANPVLAQMTADEARREGDAMGKAARQNEALRPTDESRAYEVPGYDGTNAPSLTPYWTSPDSLAPAGASSAHYDQAWQVATDPASMRPHIDNTTVKDTTARATEIENNPQAYLEGEQIDAAAGSCTPLPARVGGTTTFEATCNVGAKVLDGTERCNVPMVPQFSEGGASKYGCGRAFLEVDYRGTWEPGGESSSCSGLEDNPQCTLTSESVGTNRQYIGRAGNGINIYLSTSERHYTCLTPSSSSNGAALCNLFGCWTPSPVVDEGGGRAYTGSTEDFSSCPEPVKKGECTLTSSVCVDNDPTTRVVDGVEVTQGCWTKTNIYQCTGITSESDCGELEANSRCTYLRSNCLDGEEQSGACKVEERVYQCPVPGGASAAPNQYICGDDVYCINGDCQPIVREANTEFKDALVALHAIGQAREEFDETNFSVFRGNWESCKKPVFGLINCCAGKSSGLIPAAAGAAALAGGPAALAALATPFLLLFSCSQDEIKLDVRDRMGFCHNLGSYCTSKILGVCTQTRTAYCCFESKLSRLLQEQGRPQLGRPWAAPKEESCTGFTIDEFSRLDLSVMDFTEIYRDFIDAAKLPDEVQIMTDIQTKIQDYYDLHGQ